MKTKLHFGSQQGMALIEGMIGILIFSLGILSIVGLQAANLRQATDAKYRTDASFLANQTLGTLWADRENIGAHAVTDESVDTLPSGKRTVSVNGTEVTVTITWKLPGEKAAHRHVVVAQIVG